MQIAKKDVAEFPTYSKLSKAVSSEADTHKRPQKQRLFLPVQKAVVLEAADGSRKTISYSDAALYTLDIFEGDSVTYTDGTLQKVISEQDS